MSSLTLNVSPITINVVTDVFLIILSGIWIGLTRALSTLELKRDLRKGNKIFSFERIGSYEYFMTGRHKLTYLNQRGMLESREVRNFNFHTAFSMVGFAFTLGIVSLHALIDYGLEYGTSISNEGLTDSYQVLRFASNPNLNKELELYRSLYRSDDFCERRLYNKSYTGCRIRALAADNALERPLREAMGLASVLFQATSLGQIDAIDHMEFDYIPLYVGTDGSNDPDYCVMKPQLSATDFGGTIDFEDNDLCEQGATYVRSLTIDLRVKIIPANLLVPPSPAMGEIFEKLGINGLFQNTGFVSAKDDRQLRSTMSVVPVSAPSGAVQSGAKVVEVKVDSKIAYAEGGQHLLTVTDLGRRLGGSSTDTEFSISVGSLQRLGNICQLERISTATLIPNEFNVDVQLLFNGKTCGSKILGRAFMSRCDVVAGESFVDGEGWTPEEFGVQKGVLAAFLSGEEDCGAAVREKYADQLLPSKSGLKRGFVMGLEFETACVKGEDGSGTVDCVYGIGKVARMNGAWRSVSVSDGSDALDGLKAILLKSEISWVSVELVGADSDADEIFKNIRDAMSLSFDDVHWFTNRGAMRGRVLGAYVHDPMVSVMSLLSTQLVDSERDFLLNERVEVAIIRVEYVAGLFTVMAVCLLGAVLVAFRFLEEIWTIRRAGYDMVVPTSRTGWMESAAQSIFDGSQHETEKACEWAISNNEKLFGHTSPADP
ncbi:hypothetical protein NDN08_007016 [Rhodosorus marinus]|uniref:Uncharacterized protein n=1 Tax=Rhodosorus marinus TaxID=101924 RepID=A0AAV8UKI4_9RHOD|nr:hypothetical protein NDN08_007016 [Rhodosorus marinus]